MSISISGLCNEELISKMSHPECAICLNEFQKDQAFIGHKATATVSHIFHSDCLERWFQQARSCPTCNRTYIFDSPEKPYPLSERAQKNLMAGITLGIIFKAIVYYAF